ncbi:ABC transporter [Erythrobacter arachoides]|uniref:ABC transporter n=1 Tax=Aurantiacibacter arachoides TaxID=1850444 RepID=A0A844ZWX9_9SPHN|nr:ABC-type transport auxiliary lipoprotein family protein [Aurantiacibacter arachoides]MXO92395.1 ABC transporter [Aurantiacibacter arachoides]GGD57501.1 hypothetical protein GCM10011411_16940 [Aurantiacibacter arachoides]
MNPFKSTLVALTAAAALSTSLAGCISFGPDAPEQLLTLTPTATVPSGYSSEGQVANALSVEVPTVAQRLNVPRIPVTTSDSTLAYLVDAVWVEKPAELFRTVLSETIRAKGNRLVVADEDLEFAANTRLSGTLVAMEYDAVTSSAVVRYDAVLEMAGGRVLTQRFEERVPGVLPEATAVGAALNQATNAVADRVAEWVG